MGICGVVEKKNAGRKSDGMRIKAVESVLKGSLHVPPPSSSRSGAGLRHLFVFFRGEADPAGIRGTTSSGNLLSLGQFLYVLDS